jgi:hypothetical protein
MVDRVAAFGIPGRERTVPSSFCRFFEERAGDRVRAVIRGSEESMQLV